MQVMKVFDCHSDLLTDITDKRLGGAHNVLETYHKENLSKGDIQAMICGIWIDPPRVDDGTARMIEILGAASDEFQEMKDYAGLACNAADIERLQGEGKLAIVWGMEGLSALQGNVAFLSTLYRVGVRHAMLTWNEENEFATGIGSPHTRRGVTELGIEALHKMEELGMLVDVSHANEQTFWDVYDHTEKPFIASHSNAYSLCPAARNLKDDQIEVLAARGGVMGMNAWPEFISQDNASVEALADHVDHIVSLAGIDCVSCGFDFCDYLNDASLSFCDHVVQPTKGLEDVTKVQSFFDVLRKRGYSEEDIEKIAYKNIMRVIGQVLK